MRTAIILLSVLLFFWITGSSYVYVCKIRKDCKAEKIADVAVNAAGDTIDLSGDTLAAAADNPEIQAPAPQTLYFEFNRSTCEITADDKSHFEIIKQFLSEYGDKKVKVSGHSCAVGPEWAKEKVSAARAGFIKQKLTEAGIAPDVIETIAESDRKPASDNSTADGRSKNRRTEIIIQ